jgi:hypothetical protein
MPHLSPVLENVENKEYAILTSGKQVLVDMPYLIKYRNTIWL